ncbi:MAG: phosphatidylserine decarboxylase [Methanosarcinaceae archaeon]|nr:phosphatidylserine decarboxylase [Methanosarcinaceae archaeon]
MIAKGSFTWLAIVFTFTTCCAVASYITSVAYLWPVSYVGAALFIFFLWFFRDPERDTKVCRHCVVAPADGKVVDIRDRKVCIFMNLHNVHVNRAPVSGQVRTITHIKGGYIPAFYKDSDRNERTVMLIDTDVGEVQLTQIAGALVRRIVSYVREGDNIVQGQRIGMIRLGSRVDVTIPPQFDILCSEGDRVYAGETIIAKTEISTR